MIDIPRLQDEITEWIKRNFPNNSDLATFGGLVEEAAEVLRASVKRAQGIRGTHDEWTEEIKKESADTFIKLCDVAQYCGFDLEEAITERWSQVKQRDWQTNPDGHGLPDA